MFEQFLAGDTLEECYAAVAAVADRWLDLLDTQVRLAFPFSSYGRITADMGISLIKVWLHMGMCPTVGSVVERPQADLDMIWVRLVWQGTDVTDEELLEYISESSTMSKAMDEYEGALLILHTNSKHAMPLCLLQDPMPGMGAARGPACNQLVSPSCLQPSATAATTIFQQFTADLIIIIIIIITRLSKPD